MNSDSRLKARTRSSLGLARWLLPFVLGLLVIQIVNAAEVLRASPFGPPGHLLNVEILAKWGEAVESATRGRVRVEILGKSVAPPSGVLDAVRRNAADVSIVSNGAAGIALPRNAFVEFAAQTPEAERASVSYQRVASNHALTSEFVDVEVLAVFTHGAGAMLMAKRGVAVDAASVTLRLHAGSTGAAAAARALGAEVVAAPAPVAKTLLKERRVDGTVTALEALDGFDLAPEVDEIVLMPGGFYCAGFALIVNRARWASLSIEDRSAIRDVSGESLSHLAGRAWDAADAKALAAARARGVPVVLLPESLESRVRDASAAREAEWLAQFGMNEVDARRALAEYRAALQLR